MEQTTKDRKDLKIQALLERFSELTSQYENRIADLRVEFTITSEQYERALSEARSEIEELRQNLAQQGTVDEEVEEDEADQSD